MLEPEPSEATSPPPARSGRVAVGHPVDVASGEQFTAAHDVEVPGVEPLIFRRVYNTRFLDRTPSVLGPGWVHAFEASLTRDLDGFTFAGHDGDQVEFDDVALDFEQRGSLLNAAAAMELRREGDRLVVYHWHDADEPVQKYVFDARDGEHMLLMGRELPSGQGLEIRRDRHGRVIALTQIGERRRLYCEYDQQGRLEALRLGLASRGIEGAFVVAHYRYDERSRLVGVQNALGAEQCYAYDAANRLVFESDRCGGTYRMQYDAKGRCIETGGDGGYQLRRFIYEPGRITRVIDSQGHETLYQYNELGQVERIIHPTGAIQGTEFDDTGRISKEIDAIGATTEYSYDERGHLAAKTFPNGAKLSYQYDEQHQPTKITEPDGAVWRLRYQRGALTEVTDPTGRRVQYVRGERNQLLGATTSSGQELRIRTNDTCTEEVIEDALGLIVRRELDVYLNPTATETARGPTCRAEYDALGRLIRSQRADGSSRRFEYDPEGRVTRLVDGRGGQWVASYSDYGDCLERVDALGRGHRFSWDTETRLTGITNPKGEKAEFRRDLGGNLSSIQHFDGSIEEARYDLGARLIARKRPDGTELVFDRDIVGNPLRIKHGDVELRSFEYDVCGSPLKATSPDATISLEYDVGGRVRTEVQNGRPVAYEYGPHGFLLKRSFEGSQVGPLYFEHDSRGRLRRFSTEQGEVQAYAYDGSDNCIERRLGSVLGPTNETRQYDLQGRLRHQHIAGASTRTFNYDSEGALTELVDTLRGRRQYAYDPAEQLLSSINVQLGEHLYTYDANGNLSSKDTQRLAYDAGNRLHELGATRFERDTNGQIIRHTSAEREDRYDWDPLGQLRSVEHRDGAVTRFGYDAFGRRVFKHHEPAPAQAPTQAPTQDVAPAPGAPRHISSGRTDYYWAGDDLIAEQRQGSLTEYAIWGFVAEALWENGKLRHVVNSQQGVPQELIDDRGQLVWQGTYDDWGRLIEEKGSGTCRLRLPGQIADDETGLHYNRFRYYSPDAGQFISADPIGFDGGLNEYLFAPSGMNWVDPLGLNCPDNACQGDPRALGAKLRSGALPMPDSVLYRVAKKDAKGRPYGSPSNPNPPSPATFNPRVLVVSAGDIKIGSTLHPTNERQGGPVSTLSNADLVRFRVEDPISSRGAAGGDLNVTGGHHRLAEIERRVDAGTLPRDTPVRVLLHD